MYAGLVTEIDQEIEMTNQISTSYKPDGDIPDATVVIGAPVSNKFMAQRLQSNIRTNSKLTYTNIDIRFYDLIA